MRRLLYCGEWIESHALHIFLLHAPDFLGYDGAIEMAADHPDVVERGLRHEEGRQRPDGRSSAAARSTRSTSGSAASTGCRPRAELRARCGRRLERARDDALETVRLVAGFDFPDMEQPYEYLALRAETGYPIESGSVVTTSGGAFAVQRLHEAHRGVPRRALQRPARPPRRRAGRYVVGPLARYSLNSDRLSPVAREAARDGRARPDVPQPVPLDRRPRRRARRGLSTEALRIIDGWTDGAAPRVPVPPRAGEGYGATRGAARACCSTATSSTTTGIIRDAQIVPPTSQNQPSIEADLRALVEAWSDLDDHALPHRCEQAIRNYDPCISCATHFLDLTVDRS